MIATWALLVLVAYVIWVFNRLVRDRNQVHVAWSDIDVQLQRRHDLVPRLVEAVRGYARHEKQLLERVTRERSSARAAQDTRERASTEHALGNDLGRLVLLAEAYPDLKASANFSQLASELVEVEDAIAHARRFYNGSVRQYNTDLERFPQRLVARATGFTPATFFASDNDARANVAVNTETDRET
jgi:LemA protein